MGGREGESFFNVPIAKPPEIEVECWKNHE
jgi:hypothetical protein